MGEEWATEEAEQHSKEIACRRPVTARIAGAIRDPAVDIPAQSWRKVEAVIPLRRSAGPQRS